MAAKYILLLHVFVVFAFFFALSEARPDGAPTAACSGARPIHTSESSGNPEVPLTTANPYSFTVAVNEYVPGGTLEVTIVKAGGGMVNGFFLQARRTDTNATVGTFSSNLPVGAQFLQCTNAGDTVTHANPDGKTAPTFTWRAPVAGTGEVQFVGSVVEDHDNFYVGMMSAMLQEGNGTLATAVMTTSNAVVVSSGFGVLLFAVTAGMLQFFA